MLPTRSLRNSLVALILFALPTLACDLSSFVSLAASPTATPIPTLTPVPTLVPPTGAPVVANIVTNAVTAKQVKGDTFDPTGITDSFPGDQSIFHAVVTISNAPANTRVKAVWFTAKNSPMGEYEITTEGSRNLDFTFKPDGGRLPGGDYAVEIYVNGKLDRTLKFSVQAGASVSSSSAAPTAAPKPTTAASSSSAVPKPSGYVNNVTMAEGTQGDAKDPVNPTVVFKPSATFHAVVRTQNAPANTRFKAVWYVVDVGSAAAPNTLIDDTTLATEGSRNIDFTLAPNTTWPVGTYRVEISVNGVLDTVKTFSVK